MGQYGGVVINLIIKFQKLQNRAARILTSSSYDANVDNLFVTVGGQKRNLQRDKSSRYMVSPLII